MLQIPFRMAWRPVGHTKTHCQVPGYVLFITAVNFITASAWLLLWLPLILVWLIRMASWIDGWQDGMNGVVLLV